MLRHFEFDKNRLPEQEVHAEGPEPEQVQHVGSQILHYPVHSPL